MQKSMPLEEYEAEKNNKRTKINDVFSKLKGMKAELKRITETGNFACAYDRNFKYLCIVAWNSLNADFDINVFDCDRLKKIEIGTADYTKDVYVASTKLGSALIGGALMGGGGALVGAMLGQQGGKKEKTFATYQLQISTSDPEVSDVAYNLRYGTDIDEVKEWVTALRSLLNSKMLTKVRDKVKPETPAKKMQPSLADEILKLLNLHKEGILSSEEYQAAKSKLLS